MIFNIIHEPTSSLLKQKGEFIKVDTDNYEIFHIVCSNGKQNESPKIVKPLHGLWFIFVVEMPWFTMAINVALWKPTKTWLKGATSLKIPLKYLDQVLREGTGVQSTSLVEVVPKAGHLPSWLFSSELRWQLNSTNLMKNLMKQKPLKK